MMRLKLAAVFSLFCLILSGCGAKDGPKPDTKITTTPINVLVSEGGGPEYPLTDAYVESSLYDTKFSRLTLVGKVASGKVMVMAFRRLPNSSVPANNTDRFEATLDGIKGTNMSGSSTCSMANKVVDGNFSTTFPGLGTVTGSFTAVQLPQ